MLKTIIRDPEKDLRYPNKIDSLIFSYIQRAEMADFEHILNFGWMTQPRMQLTGVCGIRELWNDEIDGIRKAFDCHLLTLWFDQICPQDMPCNFLYFVDLLILVD